ncbi:hypothetical protein BVRB_9g213090 [Beta vulgaris subsp. vulgaris]|nr:hypothetical protein BVRB_9g213090 [Beta vulgaris subsp. vulgaris]
MYKENLKMLSHLPVNVVRGPYIFTCVNLPLFSIQPQNGQHATSLLRGGREELIKFMDAGTGGNNNNQHP